MIVRISRWHCTQEGAVEAVRLWQERLLPTVYAEAEGLIEAAFLEGPPDERIAMTRWESRDAYESAEANGLFDGISDEFAALFVDGVRPVATEYEIVARRAYRDNQDV